MKKLACMHCQKIFRACMFSGTLTPTLAEPSGRRSKASASGGEAIRVVARATPRLAAKVRQRAPEYGWTGWSIGPHRAPIDHSVPCPERQPTLIDNSKQEKSSRPNRTRKSSGRMTPGSGPTARPTGSRGFAPARFARSPSASARETLRCPAAPGGRAVSSDFHLVPGLPRLENN